MTAIEDAMKPLSTLFAEMSERKCKQCGAAFEAYFDGLCDACASKPAPKPIIPRELGETWPERHRAAIANMAGPSLDKAIALFPTIERGGMLIVAGDRGRGKTQLVTWLAWTRGQRGQNPGIYAKAFDLFSDVKATWAKASTDSETDIMRRYKVAPFLALDECHERGETDWENRTLRNVLDHRYDACLPTVIIGNWATPQDISSSLGASITDRVTETGGVVWCKWQSYRNP